MPTETALFSIIGGVCVAFVVIGLMVSHSRYRALAKKNDQIRSLTLQQRRMNNLLRTLPANYLSTDLRDFLYQAMLQNLKSQLALVKDKNDLLKSDYEQLKREHAMVKASPTETSAEPLSSDQTSIYRGLLKTLYEFIKSNYESGRLKKDHAEKILTQVQLKLVETAVDYFTLTANQFYQQKNYRQSRNAYQKALEAINDSSLASQFNQESVKLRSQLDKITEEWRESRKSASEAASTKLAGEMESLVDDQESWKKKHDYE